MKAVFFDGESIKLKEVSKPIPQKDEALIRLLYSGICNTDLEIIKGYMDYKGILGHEFVGIVESCKNKNLIGKRVVGEINCGCGECSYCQSGLSRHCPNRTVIGIDRRDGAHAEYLTLPAANLHILPDNVSSLNGVFAEPLAAALEITAQIQLEPGMRVAVIGNGKLGHLVAEMLQLYSVNLSVIGKNPFRLELSKKRGFKAWRADRVKLPPQDVVVECSGAPDGLQLAGRLLAPRGILVLKSTYHDDLSLNPSLWVIHEITLIGSRCGPFEPAIHMLNSEKIDPSYLVSKIVPSSNALDAFEMAEDKNMLKILIDWQ